MLFREAELRRKTGYSNCSRCGCCERNGDPSTDAPPDSVMIRSAHSTSDTKIAGVPNFAPQSFRSVSETQRAREHAPQEKTAMFFATTLSRISLNGGQPTGTMAFVVVLRIR